MQTGEKIVAFLLVTVILTVYSSEILLISIFAYRKFTASGDPGILWSKYAILVHLLAIAGLFCLAYSYFVEPYRIEVKTVKIRTAKLSEASFRLVQISDLHCDTKLRSEKKLIRLVNAAEPDIIVFTGDTLRLRTPSGLPLFKNTMKNLKAKLAKFAVRGNVDIWYLPDLDFFGGTGFQVLDANTLKLQKQGETLYISGLSCEHPSALRGLLKDIPRDCFSIFLYHYPDLIEDLNNLNVDLYLCGHTHGGQIALPFYGALITLSKFGKKYESGMYTVDDTILYINRGIGGHASNARFFARPEITVFDITTNRIRAD